MSRIFQSVVLAVVFGIGVLVGASVLSTGTAQPPPASPTGPPGGRYQLYLSRNIAAMYLLDTATGRAWEKVVPNDTWFDLQTPPSQEKK